MDEKLMEAFQNVLKNLTDEQKAKAEKCKTTDELMKLLGHDDIDLPDELLDAVVGGTEWDPWEFWQENNPWGCSNPYTLYTNGKSCSHDMKVLFVETAIDEGNYEKAQQAYAKYVRRYPDFHDVQAHLNYYAEKHGFEPFSG